MKFQNKKIALHIVCKAKIRNNCVGVDGFIKQEVKMEWALTDSNRRPSACKADALNQLS